MSILRIGITGGIAAGKTTFIRLLEEKGYSVINADMVSRELVKPGSQAAMAIAECFGSEFFDENGEMKRKELGKLVFSNEEAREALNKIMFPLIWAAIDRQIEQMESKASVPDVVFIEAAVLLESGGLAHVDRLWVLVCDDELRLQRLMERDGITEKEALERMASQWTQERKANYADQIFDSSDGEEALKAQMEEALKQLKKEAI